MLGQASKDINIIQKHIRKLLPGCSYLRIIPALPNSSLKQESVMRIEALEDLEGDVLHLIDPVEMLGPIEVYIRTHFLNKFIKFYLFFLKPSCG